MVVYIVMGVRVGIGVGVEVNVEWRDSLIF